MRGTESACDVEAATREGPQLIPLALFIFTEEIV